MLPAHQRVIRGEFEICVSHGDYFSSRMPLNATQQAGAKL